MKKVLMEPPESRKEIEAERREQITHTFRTATFSELVRKTQPKVKTLLCMKQIYIIEIYNTQYLRTTKGHFGTFFIFPENTLFSRTTSRIN